MYKMFQVDIEKTYNYFKINKFKFFFPLLCHILLILLMIPVDFISAIYQKLFKNQIDYDLIIFDDTYPNLSSPLRILNYHNLMDKFPNSIVYSTDGNVLYYLYHKHFFKKKYPGYIYKVKRYNPFLNYKSKISYIMFLHNVWYFLDKLENCKIPFIVSLYPETYFQLDNNKTYNRLTHIVSSKNFRSANVCEKVIHNYLIENNILDKSRIDFLLIPLNIMNFFIPPKKSFGKEKQTFDICFVAYKNMPRGVSKGYDVFIDVAQELSKNHDNFSFHVVGNFDENDIDISTIKNNIKFYGKRTTDFFPEFYSSKDIILAPLKPSSINKGSFDGFPTGAVLEASICGVAMFAADELKANYIWNDGEEIVIINRDIKDIVNKIEYYYRHLDELYLLSAKGQESCKKILKEGQENFNKLIGKYIS
jgi:glycosyltransferase involved in cell wall biosynthesis